MTQTVASDANGSSAHGEISPADAMMIAHSASDAIIVASADGTITFWNPGAERIFGYTAADALGRSLDLIIPGRLRQRHWAGWDAVIGGTPSKYGPADMLRVPAVRADGQQISVEFTITALTGDDGSIHAIAAILRDGTAMFNQLRELRAAARL
jgi:PAS domain S-box-containing protein